MRLKCILTAYNGGRIPELCEEINQICIPVAERLMGPLPPYNLAVEAKLNCAGSININNISRGATALKYQKNK